MGLEKGLEEAGAKVIRVTLSGWFRVFGVRAVKVISDWLLSHREEIAVYDAFALSKEQFKGALGKRRDELSAGLDAGKIFSNLPEWKEFNSKAQQANEHAERAMTYFEAMMMVSALEEAHRAGDLLPCFQDFEHALVMVQKARESAGEETT